MSIARRTAGQFVIFSNIDIGSVCHIATGAVVKSRIATGFCTHALALDFHLFLVDF